MTAKDLKNALLQEAVQGKLVPQIASEGNARDLLEEIRKEKGESIPLAPKPSRSTSRSCKQADSLRFVGLSATPSAGSNAARNARFEPISEDEIPFEIPETWCWCRLGEIIDLLSGQDFEPDCYNNKGDGIPYITGASNIENDTVIINRWTTIPKCIALKGDLLLVCKGSGYGTTVFADFEKAHIARQIMSLKAFGKYNCLKYVEIILCTQIKNIKAQGKGVIPGIDRNSVLSIMVSLPPLAEQKRIVAAIEKFMPLVEEYGKKETELTALNADIAKTLKNAILQEAVQGKLATQNASEGNAKDLLEEIKKEKAKLIKEGKLKKEKPLPEISEEEIPFDIPENWCWCRLGEIVYNNGQKTPDKEFSYIDIGSIDNEHQKLNEKENFIQPQNAPSRARKIVKKGDIIYSTVRPYLHNMCIIDKDFEKEPIASTGFAVLSCYPQINNQFLFYYLLSPSFDNYANDTENSKGVAYPAINDDRLYKGVVPIPPLTEQKHIVAAIEKLLPLCEKLGD